MEYGPFLLRPSASIRDFQLKTCVSGRTWAEDDLFYVSEIRVTEQKDHSVWHLGAVWIFFQYRRSLYVAHLRNACCGLWEQPDRLHVLISFFFFWKIVLDEISDRVEWDSAYQIELYMTKVVTVSHGSINYNMSDFLRYAHGYDYLTREIFFYCQNKLHTHQLVPYRVFHRKRGNHLNRKARDCKKLCFWDIRPNNDTLVRRITQNLRRAEMLQ